MSVFYSGFIGKILSARQTNGVNREAKRFSGDLFIPRSGFIPLNTAKRNLFLIFTILPTPREKFLIQNFYSNGQLTSLNVIITTHVICPTAELLVDRSSSGNDMEIFVWFSKGDINVTIAMVR